MSLNIAIIGSGNGTSVIKLMEFCKLNKLDAFIKIVMSNKCDSIILKRAREHNFLTWCEDSKNLKGDDFDELMLANLKDKNIDVILAAGYMKIFSKFFLGQCKKKVYNIHPSLLPNHKGLMDLEVHKSVIGNNEKETGCSIHEVIEEVDAGKIKLQLKCEVFTNDTPEILKKRVQNLEKNAWLYFVKNLINDKKKRGLS